MLAIMLTVSVGVASAYTEACDSRAYRIESVGDFFLATHYPLSTIHPPKGYTSEDRLFGQ